MLPSESIFALIGIAVIAFEASNSLYYYGSQLCEVTPLLTTVQVEYGGSIMNVGKTLSSSTLDQFDPSGLMVYHIGQYVARQIYGAQASNIVGNSILGSINGFFSAQPIEPNQLNWELMFVSSFSVLGGHPVYSYVGYRRITGAAQWKHISR